MTEKIHEPTALELAMANYHEAMAKTFRRGDDADFDALSRAIDAVYAAPAQRAQEVAIKIDAFLNFEHGFGIDQSLRTLLETLREDVGRAVAHDREVWKPTDAEIAQGVRPTPPPTH